MTWRGRAYQYANVDPAAGNAGGGGGNVPSRLRRGRVADIRPSNHATGGGTIPSTASPLVGYGGVGGPGPGALIGVNGQ